MTDRALIDYGRSLEVLGLESALLVDSAHAGPGDRLVPGCPWLTLIDTVRHTAGVYQVALGWLRHGRPPEKWPCTPAAEQELFDYVRVGAAELLAELGAHDADEPCATWWPGDAGYGFWGRRMAHETTVRRADVQAAAGVPVRPVDDDVAVDGIDEVLDLWLGHRLGLLGMSGTRHSEVVVRTGGRGWRVQLGPTGTAVHRVDPATADHAQAEISGTPMAVYLWLWGRLPDRAVRTRGDPDAVANLWALLRLATR